MRENDRRNYFMINLHESMGPTRDPWICNQMRYRPVRHMPVSLQGGRALKVLNVTAQVDRTKGCL